MQIEEKRMTGLVKPISLVDATLIQQGFKRSGKMEAPTYELTIVDSATMCSYHLKIPTAAEENLAQGYSRIGKPYLIRRQFVEKLKQKTDIPDSICSAVKSKLAEIADYLHSQR